MNRSYRGRVGWRETVVGVCVVVLALAGIVGLTEWLVLPGEPLEELEAPSGDDEGQPGALSCPAGSELEPEPTPVSASTLIDCPDLFDGRTVRYEGEVIEALLPHGDRVVAFLNDDPYARVGPLPENRTALGGNAGIAVTMPGEIADSVRFHGDHDTSGDVVRVLGTYHAAATTLGGQPAIVAHQATLTEPGREIAQGVSRRRVVVALLFSSATLLFFLAGRKGRD